MKKKEKEEKKKLILASVCLILFLLLVVAFFIKTAADIMLYNKYEDRGVPRFSISLTDVSLEEIDGGSKDEKYSGNELKIYNDGKIDNYNNVEIKGRGNGTWRENKKPYQIKFEEKIDLLGMGKARKWFLLANAMDGSNLRTEAAIYVEKMLGMEYFLEGRFIELYIDNDYRGLYYLTHAIEIGKTSVNLRNPMGILVELDNIYGTAEVNSITNNGEIMVVKDLVSEDNYESAMEDFMRAYNELEVAIKEKDFEKVSSVADVDSFAKYFLLSEFTVNPDAYWTSFYFYKDGVKDKIHAGPGWDFDLAFGNRRWGNWLGERFYSPMETMVRKNEILPKEFYELEGIKNKNGFENSVKLSTIIFDLMEMPEFKERVKELFNERMSGRVTELMWAIREKEKIIQEAAYFDDDKWGKTEFDNEVELMLEWIKERYKYFEQEYGDNKNLMVTI